MPTPPPASSYPFLRWLHKPLAFHLSVLALVLAYASIRITLLPSLGGDEVEQVLFAQTLSWGYDVANPPLYTWLVLGAFAVFGKSAGTVLFVKFAILGLVYIALYHAAALSLGPDRRWEAVLVGLSPLLLYIVNWLSIFNLSHALLMTLFIILTFLLFLRAASTEKMRWFVLLGLVIGCGVLSKYTYLMFLAGLLGAALTIPEMRSPLVLRRMTMAVLLGAIITLPHMAWLLDNVTQLREAAAIKLQIGFDTYLETVTAGFWSLARQLFSFASPFWLIALLLFPTIFLPLKGSANSPLVNVLLGRTHLIILLILVGLVLVSGVTRFRPNYMFPFILLPLWMMARLPDDYRTGRRMKVFGAITVLFGLLSSGVLLGKAVAEPYTCKKCQNLLPYETIAQNLRNAGFERGTVFAHWYPNPLPGNLALHLDDAKVVSQKFPHLRPPSDTAPGQCLVVWVSSEQGGPIAAQFLSDARRDFKFRNSTPPVIHKRRFALDRAPDKFVIVEFVLWDPGQGDCR